MRERSPEQRRGGGEGGWKQPRNQIRDDGMGQVEVLAGVEGWSWKREKEREREGRGNYIYKWQISKTKDSKIARFIRELPEESFFFFLSFFSPPPFPLSFWGKIVADFSAPLPNLMR